MGNMINPILIGKKEGVYAWKKHNTYNKIVGDTKSSYSLGTAYTNCFMFPQGNPRGTGTKEIIAGNYILYDKAHDRWCYFDYTTSANDFRYISVYDVNTNGLIGNLKAYDAHGNYLRYTMSDNMWFDESFFLIDTNDPYFYTRKTVILKGSFVDYVVSDKEDAYPDKDIHTDGYYYEKVVDGITPEMLGCTKMAIDTFAFTADTAINTTINHSLGEKPKYLFVLIDAEPASAATTRVKKFIGFGTDNSDLMGYMLYNVTSQTSIYFVATDTTVRSSTTNYYWYGGIKYTVITMA